ncbi:sigma-70 family RNA polymerase sigma factor [Terriglobus albidus]|uniref:sigma-70 family RNA polymerase sigma factor n=1 Tax=Terriglobus albidus TaxID=1592106 RepID=UPI0021E09A68|nr:sigma-70 family RNA polymerase sigma factor [Terriglobus albidus]
MIQLEKVQYTADGFLSPTDPHLKWNRQTSEYDDGLSAFLHLRRNLFGVAYRILKSAAEAEDIVQDVWLRWQATDRSLVLDPPAFLMTITTRMCINLCKSARSRRETYVGTWFSEPVDPTTDPRLGAERKEALKNAVLVLLAKLRPTERAAYVLREAFDYSYCQIAEILQLKETNVRQLLTRARKHIAARQPAAVSSAERRRFLAAFTAAAQNGDLVKLEGLFAPGVVPDAKENTAADLEPPPMEQNLTCCHKTAGYTVLTSATVRCEADRKEGLDHMDPGPSSIGPLATHGLVRAVNIGCK